MRSLLLVLRKMFTKNFMKKLFKNELCYTNAYGITMQIT